MADIVDCATRSRMMKGIGSRNTRPEIALRSALHRRGLRFRLHVKELPGKPDLVLPRFRAVIFVHGCFWHRHAGCRYASVPATRAEFWQAKFADNIARDVRNRALLLEMGWRVAVVWECSLRRDDGSVAEATCAWLKGQNGTVFEI
jgi:DNA mismatch endonuclease, patch repair protein